MTAYHEAGHALVGWFMPQHDPIYKATIIPRGRALGMVMPVPERDSYSVTKTKYTSQLAMAMAGKAAEEIKYGEDNVTSGAASDIQQVSKIARAMVTQFGFSDKVGHIDYANQQESYLGNFQAGASNISGATQKVIDEEVRRLIDEAYATAKGLLTEKNDEFERIAQALLEFETLDNDDLKKVIAGEPLERSDDLDTPPSPSGGSGHSAIPKAGKPRRGDGEPDPGMEPQPN